MADKKTIAIWVLAVLGALQFLFAGITKAADLMGMVGMIHDTLGTPEVLLRIIGAAEVVGAVLLLWPKTRWYAAEALAGIVLVAAVWHMVAGDWAGLPGALIALAITGTLSWLDRPAWFREKYF